MEKFCRECPKPGAITKSECSIHSQKGYLGCFSNPKDAPVWQVCVGRKKGEDCMYETAASSKGGNKKPALNTTGHCIGHHSHQGIMCLEAIGDDDDGECNGKGVGQPCTHSESASAICVHHSRRGTWMCLADKEESMVFLVCQNKKKGDKCTFQGSGEHGQDSGLIQGECHTHDEALAGGKSVSSHGIMMCIDPDHIDLIEPTTESPTMASASVLVSPKALSAMMLLNYFV